MMNDVNYRNDIDLFEDDDSLLTPSVPNLIGVSLKKYFNYSLWGPAGWYKGEVQYYQHPYYRVVYADGDEEDMTLNEVLHYANWIFE